MRTVGLALFGLVIGVLVGWLTRPAVLLGVRLSFEDFLDVVQSDTPLDAPIANMYLEHLGLAGAIGAACGIVLSLLIGRRAG
ncbi:MAG: hypothetical protein AAF677_10665 [Pseudomonadota bacterium]